MKMNMEDKDGGNGKVDVLEPPGFQRYCASEALCLCLLKWYKKWSVGGLVVYCYSEERPNGQDGE